MPQYGEVMSIGLRICIKVFTIANYEQVPPPPGL